MGALDYITHFLWGDPIGLPLRASNEGLPRPRVARAQETNRVTPLPPTPGGVRGRSGSSLTGPAVSKFERSFHRHHTLSSHLHSLNDVVIRFDLYENLRWAIDLIALFDNDFRHRRHIDHTILHQIGA